MISRVSETGELDCLSEALDSFRCCLDPDIEDFLRHKTELFLSRKWCSIYLILVKEDFISKRITVAAYFTLSHKAVIPDFASKSAIQKTSGFKDSRVIPFVLIGQLGKYKAKGTDGKIVSSDISSKEILDFAFEVIQESNNLIPCRCALVECSANPQVQQAYKNYGFSYFQFDGEHHQLYKTI